jgi:HSP20 family protein
MSRWDPFREMLSLREAMNQLLEESYVRPGQRGGGGAGAPGRTQSLALDVGERENAYVVTASLPGIRPEDVQVTVLGDTLTIRAETGGQQERSEGGYLLRERHSGVLQRTVTLPSTIDSENVQAEYEHGVLTLTLPKSRASMPRRIEVRAGRGGGGQPQIAGASGSPAGQQGAATADRPEEDEAARLPSLEEQTPGLDRQQEQQTAADAQAFFGQESGRQESGGQESGGTTRGRRGQRSQASSSGQEGQESQAGQSRTRSTRRRTTGG